MKNLDFKYVCLYYLSFAYFRSSKDDLILDIFLEIITFLFLPTGTSIFFDNGLIKGLKMHLDNIFHFFTYLLISTRRTGFLTKTSQGYVTDMS